MLQTWQISLSARIDGSRPAPLYVQIIQAVIRDIESGRLTPGTYLPSTRELARILEVNRKTVVVAYEDLIAQGWLSTSATRGTMISMRLPDGSADIERPRSAESGAVKIEYSFRGAPDRPLALPEGEGLKIDEGSPDGRLFPSEVLVRAYRAATQRAARENGFQYRDPRGSGALRKSIAEMLRVQRGLAVGEENICITRGSQNGIFLAGLALLRPGDAVIVEALTYEPAVAAFESLGARVIPVGLDENGINTDEVEQLCKAGKIRAAFVTPHHQFPTTVALRADRRLRLVELAREHGFAIIEDDYDHEFHFESQPLLPIAAYAPGQVIYIGSLSKLLLPALRIGYVAGPATLIEALAHNVSLTDGMGNTLTENAAATLIANGELRRHARKARQIYADRRRRFAHELAEAIGDRISFRIPDGGLAIWAQFRGDLEMIERRAVAAGLRFAASQSFRNRQDAPRGLRLGFASLNEGEAGRAIAALAKATR